MIVLKSNRFQLNSARNLVIPDDQGHVPVPPLAQFLAVEPPEPREAVPPVYPGLVAERLAARHEDVVPVDDGARLVDAVGQLGLVGPGPSL